MERKKKSRRCSAINAADIGFWMQETWRDFGCKKLGEILARHSVIYSEHVTARKLSSEDMKHIIDS